MCQAQVSAPPSTVTGTQGALSEVGPANRETLPCILERAKSELEWSVGLCWAMGVHHVLSLERWLLAQMPHLSNRRPCPPVLLLGFPRPDSCKQVNIECAMLGTESCGSGSVWAGESGKASQGRGPVG